MRSPTRRYVTANREDDVATLFISNLCKSERSARVCAVRKSKRVRAGRGRARAGRASAARSECRASRVQVKACSGQGKFRARRGPGRGGVRARQVQGEARSGGGRVRARPVQ